MVLPMPLFTPEDQGTKEKKSKKENTKEQGAKEE